MWGRAYLISDAVPVPDDEHETHVVLEEVLRVGGLGFDVDPVRRARSRRMAHSEVGVHALDHFGAAVDEDGDVVHLLDDLWADPVRALHQCHCCPTADPGHAGGDCGLQSVVDGEGDGALGVAGALQEELLHGLVGADGQVDSDGGVAEGGSQWGVLRVLPDGGRLDGVSGGARLGGAPAPAAVVGAEDGRLRLLAERHLGSQVLDCEGRSKRVYVMRNCA